jgi:DNA-binding transcriptional ArsR family regulator
MFPKSQRPTLEGHIYYNVKYSRRESSLSWSNTMSANTRQLRYLLGWLIAGTRGGPTRARIIETLKENPQNANQLATLLGMDYRTIRHHLNVLQKNKIITAVGEGYGMVYFLSQTLEDNYVVFEEIRKGLWKK